MSSNPELMINRNQSTKAILNNNKPPIPQPVQRESYDNFNPLEPAAYGMPSERNNHMEFNRMSFGTPEN